MGGKKAQKDKMPTLSQNDKHYNKQTILDGQFQQCIGAKRKFTVAQSLMQSVSPPKLRPTLPEHRTFMLYTLGHTPVNSAQIYWRKRCQQTDIS